MMAEDLVGTIFPDQVACAENLVGEREVPDHPLVAQTISDCLNEAMDIDGLERLLTDIDSGAIRIVARDLTEPSPLAREVLTARPYAYLDDAPLEERRTQAVMSRRWLDPDSAGDLPAKPALVPRPGLVVGDAGTAAAPDRDVLRRDSSRALPEDGAVQARGRVGRMAAGWDGIELQGRCCPVAPVRPDHRVHDGGRLGAGGMG